jgi:hypothetical protein
MIPSCTVCALCEAAGVAFGGFTPGGTAAAGGAAPIN